MKLSARLHHLLITLLCITMAGCGWQLRGLHSDTLANQTISLNHERINNPLFVKTFRDTLSNSYQIQISNSSNTQVSITSLKEQQRVSSKDRNGDTTELEHIVNLSIKTELEANSFKNKFTSYSKQNYNQNNILSSDLKTKSAKIEAYQDLAHQYAHYLSVQLNK